MKALLNDLRLYIAETLMMAIVRYLMPEGMHKTLLYSLFGEYAQFERKDIERTMKKMGKEKYKKVK